MFDKINQKFIEYVKTYDLTIPEIEHKFRHSFRVMDYSREIAKSLGLSDHDIELAAIIGLLHDISRFEQWAKYNTFYDAISIDHGDLSFNILKSFLEESEVKDIILVAAKNHNKAEIEEGLDDKTLLFCKIVRDADKLDIMQEVEVKLTDNIGFIESEIIKCFEKEELLKSVCSKESDNLFRMLAFVYDINFKYTFEFILKNDVVKKRIDLLEKYSTEIDKIKYIKDSLYNYINRKIN